MSDHERFSQVAQKKWAIVSESLRLLTKNERIAPFFERIAHSLIFGQETSNSLGKQVSEFPALNLGQGPPHRVVWGAADRSVNTV